MLILVIEGTVTDLMCADQVVVIIDLQFIFDSNQFDSFGDEFFGTEYPCPS